MQQVLFQLSLLVPLLLRQMRLLQAFGGSLVEKLGLNDDEHCLTIILLLELLLYTSLIVALALSSTPLFK